MDTRISIQEALSVWAESRQQHISEKNHVDINSIFLNIKQEGAVLSRDIEHLILCSECMSNISPSQKIQEEPVYWETAWRKAARRAQWHSDGIEK